jgi:hypothetical protein
MGHHIRGVLGGAIATERFVAALPRAITPVVLGAGILWTPLDDDAVDSIDATQTAIREDPADRELVHLTAHLAGLVARCSGREGLAYFETEYFGGVGSQGAAAWRDGDRVLTSGTVSAALRLLGVQRTATKDEWDVVGLAHHRRMPGE